MKKYLLVFISILTIFALTGCQSPEENQNVNTTSDEETQAEVKETRTIEHAMGKTEIKGTPKRVVTLYQGATDVAIALDIKPVGIVESWVEKPKYNYLRDDLKDIPIVGLETQPNLEEISKLNPDLIIASKLRHEKIYDKLSKIAPTVTHETVFKFKDTVKLMGNALNKQQKANALLDKWKSRVTDLREKLKEKYSDKWPLEVSVLNFRADHTRIYTTGFAGDILKEVGFKRPKNQQKAADEGKVVVKLTTKESIPSMNADAFFIFMRDDKAAKETYENWTSHPLWKNLDAVKNNEVSFVDIVAWNMAGGYLSAHDMLDQLYEHFELEN